MAKVLTPAQRLIVVADREPTLCDKARYTWDRMYRLMDYCIGTGILLQVGSAREICGDDLLRKIHSNGFTAVVCSKDIIALRDLKVRLPHTHVLGVPPVNDVARFAECAVDAGLDGIAPPLKGARELRLQFGTKLSFSVSALPEWTSAGRAHANGVPTLAEAFKAGADRFIVDLEVFRAGKNYVLESLERTLAEIARVTAPQE